jgi:predicted ATPase
VLVGREEESGLLRRRWEQSKAGLGQVVLISGEAGIGKSALVEALRAQVRAEGLPRIAFRCSPYHTTSALYPMITHLEHLLQLAPDDAPATRLAKLEAGLRPSGLPLAEVMPLLAGLLSIPHPGRRLCVVALEHPTAGARPGRGAPPGGEIAEAACRHEPGTPVAAARQTPGGV